MDEASYYPYGLTMSGISSLAVGKQENRYKFNSIDFNREFDLNTYEAQFRNLDPQTGRWLQIDPRPNDMVSPYAAISLNEYLWCNEF